MIWYPWNPQVICNTWYKCSVCTILKIHWVFMIPSRKWFNISGRQLWKKYLENYTAYKHPTGTSMLVVTCKVIDIISEALQYAWHSKLTVFLYQLVIIYNPGQCSLVPLSPQAALMTIINCRVSGGVLGTNVLTQKSLQKHLQGTHRHMTPE